MSEADDIYAERLATEIALWHQRADETNDVHDHDELHAAGTVVAGDGVWVDSEPYLVRWIEGLRRLYDVPEAEWPEEAPSD